MPKKTVVTSALLYANGPLHIGHLVEYIQTDIFVRFMRLKGEDVVYCCADDTHGAPIQINADKAGVSPKELIKKFYKEHVRDFKKFGVVFDNYYTTDSKENQKFSDLMFKRAQDNGHIYKKKIRQFFCEHDNMFLPDRYVKGICPKCGALEQYGDVCEKCGATYKPTELGEPKCAICGRAPVQKTSEHYFFRLSAFSDKLEDWLKNPKLQKEIVNSVRQWIKEGLEDWDITRDGPYFGFKIPGEDNLYYYVWWDAPIGYIATLDNLKGDAEKYWNDSEVMHFIGKDIIYFHFLFWPAVLMSAGFSLPKGISVHGFLTVNGEKMSKSRGTFLTANDFSKKYDAEQLRYFYATGLGRKLSDIDLSFDDFHAKVNNELVANLGNFCYRTLSFTNRFFDSKIAVPENHEIIEQITVKVNETDEYYQELNFKEATHCIMAISDLGNKYMQESAPWKLIKEDKEKAHSVMSLCVNIAKDLAILMKPIMPEFSRQLEKQLALKGLSWKDLGFNLKNHNINKAELLVHKLEKEEEKIFPYDLRVGQIKSCEPHPDADKLMVMKVDMGTESRQIVAGLKDYYEPQEVIGKIAIIVANLKPAKLRGIESQGMLLAAEKDKIVKIIFNKSIPGESVCPAGYIVSKEQISIDKFMKLNKLIVQDGKVLFCEDQLKTKTEKISIDMPDGSTVR